MTAVTKIILKHKPGSPPPHTLENAGRIYHQRRQRRHSHSLLTTAERAVPEYTPHTTDFHSRKYQRLNEWQNTLAYPHLFTPPKPVFLVYVAFESWSSLKYSPLECDLAVQLSRDIYLERESAGQPK